MAEVMSCVKCSRLREAVEVLTDLIELKSRELALLKKSFGEHMIKHDEEARR